MNSPTIRSSHRHPLAGRILWEAFVSGSRKSPNHVGDAGLAVEESEQFAFGLGDVEGFTHGACAVAQSTADTSEDIGQRRRKSRQAGRGVGEGQGHVYL